MLARKRQVDALDQSLPVAAVEDVILLKLLAARPLDLADAAELYSIHAASLDAAYLESSAKDLGVGDRLVALRAGH